MADINALEGLFGTVRCASCGVMYSREDITVVGNRDEYWFLRCACQSCGIQGIGVVIVKEVDSATLQPQVTSTLVREPGLAVEDVLEAHEILRDYAGDVHRLFTRTPQK